MKISHEFNEQLIKDISTNAESKSVKGCQGYLSFLKYNSGNRFYFVSVDDVAFCGGSFGKKHFRLAELAVKKEFQRKGYGKAIIQMLKQECYRRGVCKITLRTSKTDTAYEFYAKYGGMITGSNGDDYEMEINI